MGEPGEPSSPDDDYAARYMDGGRAVVRTRQRMAWWFFAILAFAAVAQVLSAVVAGSLVSLVTLPLVAVVAILFSHLRVTVTDSKLYIQYGVFGPTIALSQIDSAKVVKYKAMKFGGWGIKRALDGTRAYSVPGNDGEAVEVSYRDDGGATHKLVVTTTRSESVCRAILEGSARSREKTSGVRIVPEGASNTPVDDQSEVNNSQKAGKTQRGE